jgi:glycosyltransferase involved in cell wall biosynthesis
MDENRKLAIITACTDDWGGSEELWAKCIPLLIDKGISNITVIKNHVNSAHPEFVNLKKQHIHFEELDPVFKSHQKIALKIADLAYKIGDKVGLSTYKWNKPIHRLHKILKRRQPDLVLVSQGINFDGLAFAHECLKLNIPYIVVCHKAVDFFWPMEADREYMKKTLLHAKKVFFVSEHNRILTEEQFGVRLTNSDIVLNPIKMRAAPMDYPPISNGYKLACIGRLFVIDKGQDILLRVLAKPKWKERNLSVSFIGKGPDNAGLKEMSKLLKVDQVSFSGFQQHIKDIWADHHALILPSRSEGLPLTIIEAMSVGRMVIATNAGGNQEIVQDQVTGFIADINEKSLDETMELAWNKRDEWQNMGLQGSEHIAATIPECPELKFADFIFENLNQQKSES